MEQLWEDFINAMDAGDTASLRGLHTPDATLTHMTGHVATLDEWMAGIDRGDFVYHRIDVREVEFGDGRIVGWITTGITDDGSGQAWPLRVEIDVVEVGGVPMVAASRVTLDRSPWRR